MIKKIALSFTLLLCSISNLPSIQLPQLNKEKALEKVHEIMGQHAAYKQLNPQIIRQTIALFLEQLDPTKTYFIEEDIKEWVNPSDEQVKVVLEQYEKGDFTAFEKLYQTMQKAIERRRKIEKEIAYDNLPNDVKAEEFKDLEWAKGDKELQERITRIRALQIKIAEKLIGEGKETTLQRIAKSQMRFEEDFTSSDEQHRQRHMLTDLIKATAGALDTHTSYFTPDEARRFLINVQQRLFGIGVQLKDDLAGLVVMQIVEGGPASKNKELKINDRIIAVNGQPIVGLDIVDAVELIRGPEGSVVELTVMRESGEGEEKKDEKLEIKITRGEVVIKESRYASQLVPFGDGAIAYLRLFSFYQDPEHSSATDLLAELEKMKREHKIYGVILDLRSNAGGMLTQAVSVAGLFMSKGIVVSIKDESGQVQHLRDLDPVPAWDGPLIVLVNRASASSSEIVAQALQDYGRSITVGDDHTFGKGSFQTFTLGVDGVDQVNPEGEYKVTRGRYYTVSGKTPQLQGVISDIVVPGGLSESEIGERYYKFPLDNDSIPPNFDDDLSDLPFFQRARMGFLYKYNLQPKLELDKKLINQLSENSKKRLEQDKNYQAFIKEVKSRAKDSNEIEVEEESVGKWGQSDLQLQETVNIMKDLLFIKDRGGKQQGL